MKRILLQIFEITVAMFIVVILCIPMFCMLEEHKYEKIGEVDAALKEKVDTVLKYKESDSTKVTIKVTREEP